MEVAQAAVSASDREAWLAARREKLTASDVACVLGLNSSKPRSVVLKEKVTRTDVGEDPGELAMVAAGRFLEEGIFKWFASETIHTTAHMCGQMLTSPVLSCLAATPDAVMDGEPVEIKCTMHTSRPNWHALTTSRKGWNQDLAWPLPIATNYRFPPENLRTAKGDMGTAKGNFRDLARAQLELIKEFGDANAPIKYWVQLQVQMHVLSAPRGWLVGLMGGTGRIDIYYERHLAFERYMLEEVAKFWAEVEEKRNKK